MMMNRYWLFLSVTISVISQGFQELDCLTLTHLSYKLENIFSGDEFAIKFAWPKALSNVTNTALALAGYQIDSQSSFLSYKAQTTDVSQHGASIILKPKSKLLVIQFQILAVGQDAIGQIQLYSSRVHPQALKNAQRTINHQKFIFQSSLEVNQSSDIFLSVYLQDLTMDLSNSNQQQLGIKQLLLFNKTITVTLYSYQGFKNSISEVTLTLLVIKKSAFGSSLVHYNKEYHTWCPSSSSSCSRSTSLFSSFLEPSYISAQKCIIPIYWLTTYQQNPNGFENSLLISTNQSNIMFKTDNSIWAFYNISCFFNCPKGYYLFHQDSISSCEACPSSCKTCQNALACTECVSGYFLQKGICKLLVTSTTTQIILCFIGILIIVFCCSSKGAELRQKITSCCDSSKNQHRGINQEERERGLSAHDRDITMYRIKQTQKDSARH